MQFGSAANSNLANNLTGNLPNLEPSTPSIASNPLINTPVAVLNQNLNQALNPTANPSSSILPNSAPFVPNNFNLMGLMGNAATAASSNSNPYSSGESFVLKLYYELQSIVEVY